MKLILRNSIIFFLLIMGTIFITTHGDKIYAFVSEMFEDENGVLSILSVDAENGHPIKDTKFQVIDMEANVIIEEIITSSDGIATTKQLPLQRDFLIKQIDIKKPYVLDTEPKLIELVREQLTITFESEVHPSIMAYNISDQEIIATKMNLSVPKVLQVPELPNGCEITSLASVLQYYGYDAEKTVLSDNYLPKIPFEVKDGKLFGADPYQAYAGEPRSKNQGFYSYVPPIIDAANQFFKDVNGHHVPEDISGSSPEEVLNYIRQGIPVIIWTTINQKDPLFNYSWYLPGTSKSIDVIRNSHTVVLTGFSENEVFVMDPLKGNVSYPKERFFDIYELAGSHAMVVR